MKGEEGINVLSLFDGMSCGRIALDRAGIAVNKYYASEIDKYAITVAQANYPDTIQLGDITKINLDNLPKIDLLIGGSPCQGFSFAGKQLAFDDPRSKLFFEYTKILSTLEDRNPYIKFLLENVRMKKEYLDVISGLLGVQPICINSALVSAQNRVRYYWTNIEGIDQPADRSIYLCDIIENGVMDRDKSFCVDANYFKGGNLKAYFEKHRRQLIFNKPIRIFFVNIKSFRLPIWTVFPAFFGSFIPGKSKPRKTVVDCRFSLRHPPFYIGVLNS